MPEFQIIIGGKSTVLMANDDYQAFKCPSCKQYISNRVDTCRFCDAVITDEMKEKAIEEELEENRQFQLKSHKLFLYSGLGTMGFGLLLLIASLASIFFTDEGRFFIWSPILIVLGVAQMIYASVGMFEERKRKK